ncbi:hypothetical protein H6G65_02975 [Microcystis elabens FACHB-917]|nr:hypothetical protein [Microcystis elabens FACHB-917]
MRRPSRPRLASLPILVVLVGPALGSLPVRASESAVVQENVHGNELFIDGKTAKVKQMAVAPQKLSTQSSRGQIRFDSGAAGRLNRFALLKLGQGCFLLSSGQILVSGRQDGRTRSSRLSTRGTDDLISLLEGGEQEVTVLEGSVELQPLADGRPLPGMAALEAFVLRRFPGVIAASPRPAVSRDPLVATINRYRGIDCVRLERSGRAAAICTLWSPLPR